MSFGALDFKNSGGSLRLASLSKVKYDKTASKRGSLLYGYFGGVPGFRIHWDLRGWASKDQVSTFIAGRLKT